VARPQRIKRWLVAAAKLRRSALLFAAGLVIVIVGLSLSYQLLLVPAFQSVAFGVGRLLSAMVGEAQLPLAKHIASGALLLLGAYMMIYGARAGLHQLLRAAIPTWDGKLNSFLRQRMLASGPNVVVIGGGTGLSTVLRGLKHRTSRITAIVTVSDDGGSSGRLASEKGMLPPGDIRNCLVALADAEKAMTDLFQHRFEKASGSLSGHSTGNLLIAAMVDLTGDFDHAIQEISKVLAIRGRVIPATLDRVRLRAEMEDGTEICGETRIVASRLRVRKIYLDPPDAAPVPDALEAISDADIVVLGPGSVYTSVIPPLLVPGIPEAIAESNAIKVYVCNVMTQPGESDQFTASEHVHAIEANVGKRVCDYVLVNKARPSQYLLNRYAEVGQEFVEPDSDRIRAMGIRAVAANLISESDVVRHDPMRLADSIMRLLN